MVKSCGFKTKASNIVEACRLILHRHGGQVPGDMAALTALPGVGQKTANVVLANAFGVPTIAVDTHVFRVSNRLGLANHRGAVEGCHSQEGLGGSAPLAHFSRTAGVPFPAASLRHMHIEGYVQGL